MVIVARFYPNGEFTAGFDTSSRRKKAVPKPEEPFYEHIDPCLRDLYLQWYCRDGHADMGLYVSGRCFYDNNGGAWTYLAQDSDGHKWAYEPPDGNGEVRNVDVPIGALVALGLLEPAPLVHQEVEFSPPPPSRKRCLSMSTSMRRNIRNAAYMMEQDYGKDNLSFLTLTLPDLSSEDLQSCSDNWGKMVDQILKYLRKRVEKHGINFAYVYCSEIQLKRLQQRGEYALHLHILFRGRCAKKKPWCVTPCQVRKAWAGIIRCVIGHSRFCADALENLQVIRRSAGAYIAKYLSKGVHLDTPGGEEAVAGVPPVTHWGGMARLVARRIRKCSCYLRSSGSNGYLVDRFISELELLRNGGYIDYFHVGFITLSSSDINSHRGIFTWSGRLHVPTYQGGLAAVFAVVEAMPTIEC